LLPLRGWQDAELKEGVSRFTDASNLDGSEPGGSCGDDIQFVVVEEEQPIGRTSRHVDYVVEDLRVGLNQVQFVGEKQ
jgi:hypothetical protein